MKFKQFLFAAFIAAFAGMAMVGCNENPDDPGPGGDDVNPVTNLEAVSLSSTEVGLRWTASTSDVDEYRISVRGPGGTEVTTATATGTSATIEDLTAGTIYTFGVTAVDTDLASGDDESVETTVVWSPALRFDEQTQPTTTTLRLYPRSVSDKGSGILITSTGARNASANTSSPDRSEFQLLADIQDDGAGFVIGAPKATEFEDFLAYGDFKADVQASNTSFEIDDLDSWYRDASLADLFTGTGSANAFSFGDRLPSGKGVGFAIRWGSAGQYRYARVFVVPTTSGELIREDVVSNDPYVEVQISYQDAAGVPYAKGN